MINYQGRLTDSDGAPVADNTYFVKFKIYGSASGDDSLWYTGFQPVLVTGGLFSYQLGSVEPLPDDLFAASSARYLGITVGADPEMTERTKIVSVAYAYQALRADSAQHAALAASVPPGSIGAAEINTDEVQVRIASPCQSGFYISEINEDGTVVCAKDQAGSGNWSVTDSVLYTNNLWGIARGGADNAVLGVGYTAVNLGVACTTGTVGSGQTVSGGYRNVVIEGYGTVGGGEGNTVIEPYGTVGGGIDNTADYKCTVGGGNDNTATDTKSTVGGGNHNTASNSYATVAGGTSNLASGDGSTIGGGDDNEASGLRSTVSGGGNNRALSDYTWIGGGQNNTTKGLAAAVPGGVNNTAAGDYSLACGNKATALHEGTFVWADASGLELESTEPNQFLIRAAGGTKIYSNADLTAGVTMHAGASAWAINSDRDLKDQFTPVDTRELLDKVASLPITTWNYKSQDESIRHIGPMAQDFSAAFGVGEDDTHISTVDSDGVALAAIQALLEKVELLEKRIAELEAQNK